MLFPGGDGNIGLASLFGKPVITNLKNNFLVRSKGKLSDNGFVTVVVDKPSDKNNLSGFRLSKEHAEDIRGIVKYLKENYGLPVWLVGTSAGTFSAAHGAISLKNHMDGLILSSSLTALPKKYRKVLPEGVLSLDVDEIEVPTLVLHHEKDGCGKCPPSGAKKFEKALVNSPKVVVKMFNGGFPPQSGPCQGKSFHGFYGIEDEVVKEMSNFISAFLEAGSLSSPSNLHISEKFKTDQKRNF